MAKSKWNWVVGTFQLGKSITEQVSCIQANSDWHENNTKTEKQITNRFSHHLGINNIQHLALPHDGAIRLKESQQANHWLLVSLKANTTVCCAELVLISTTYVSRAQETVQLS